MTLNDKILCKPYTKKGEGLKRKEVVTGFSGVSQKSTIAVVETVADFHMANGTLIPAGSKLMIEETELTTKAWSTKAFEIEDEEALGKVIIIQSSAIIGFVYDDGLIPEEMPSQQPTDKV